MKTRQIILLLLGCLGFAVIVAYALSVPTEQPYEHTIVVIEDSPSIISAPDNGAKIDYKGHVTITKTEAATGKQTIIADKDNLLVTNGKNFIYRKLNGLDVNASNRTLAISLSNDGTAPDAAWTQIPSEITTNGLSRNQSATLTTNGTGWNVTANFTATGSQSAQLTGLQWNNASNTDGNLFAALQFASQSLLVGDGLQVNWQITIG